MVRSLIFYYMYKHLYHNPYQKRSGEPLKSIVSMLNHIIKIRLQRIITKNVSPIFISTFLTQFLYHQTTRNKKLFQKLYFVHPIRNCLFTERNIDFPCVCHSKTIKLLFTFIVYFCFLIQMSIRFVLLLFDIILFDYSGMIALLYFKLFVTTKYAYICEPFGWFSAQIALGNRINGHQFGFFMQIRFWS